MSVPDRPPPPPKRPAWLPWHRRGPVLALALTASAAWVVAMAPPLGAPVGVLDAIGLALAFGAYLAATVVIQTDRHKPLWLKNVTVLGLFALLALLFYRHAGGNWDRLGYYFFNFEVMSRGDAWFRMLRGLWLAVQVFLYSLALSTVLGLLLAIVRSIVNDKLLNVVIDAYSDVFRAVPPIVLLLVTYSALPYSGIVLSPFQTGVVALTLIEAAYLCEVFRSGIEAIHRNQVLSARSIGLSAWKAMRLVVLPQAVRIVVPDYTNRVIGLMKRTAETSVIAIAEILQTAQQLQSQHVNATPLIVGALLYMVVLFPLARVASALERSRPRS